MCYFGVYLHTSFNKCSENFLCSLSGPRGKLMDGDECPLHVKHPSTGEEFALGFGVCRNAHTF